MVVLIAGRKRQKLLHLTPTWNHREGLFVVDIVEKLRTLFHAAIEGVISVRRVLSNKLSDGKYQSNALSCTVDFAGQSFSTESVEPRSRGTSHLWGFLYLCMTEPGLKADLPSGEGAL